MNEQQLQPAKSWPAALSPTPPPPPLSSLKPAFADDVDFTDSGFDFYPSSFDNPSPYGGILNNERTFTRSSPTSNTAFLPETSFSTPLKNLSDSGIHDSKGLLTITSTPQHAPGAPPGFQPFHNGGDGGLSAQDLLNGENFLQCNENDSIFNDSGFSTTSVGVASQAWGSPSTATPSTANNNHFEFSFSESVINGDGSSNGSSSASADSSPSRLSNDAISGFSNQWGDGNVMSLLEHLPLESSDGNFKSGSSIWSSSQVSAASADNGNAFSSKGEQWDEALVRMSKNELLAFATILENALEESNREGDVEKSYKINNAMVLVQRRIINELVDIVNPVGTPIQNDAPALLPTPPDYAFEAMARMHRDVNGSQVKTWSGHLPPRIHRCPTYSSKVFLGGLPWDVTELTLMKAFQPYGIDRIEWPGKEGQTTTKPKGYAYAVFENEKQVKMLLQNCTVNYNRSTTGNYYYKISSMKFREKDVQIIPWAHSDSNFTRCPSSKLDAHKTVFVGAVHGMVNAEGLATIMNDLFGNVVYAGIDLDKKKYPIGSARVTFSSIHSYMKAVSAAYIFIKTNRFQKIIQVDPYLLDATCSVCNLQQGPYFCRDRACFRYFCRTCFHVKHKESQFRGHFPMMRTTHNKQEQGLYCGMFFNRNGNNHNNSGQGICSPGGQPFHNFSNYKGNWGNRHHNYHNNNNNNMPEKRFREPNPPTPLSRAHGHLPFARFSNFPRPKAEGSQFFRNNPGGHFNNGNHWHGHNGSSGRWSDGRHSPPVMSHNGNNFGALGSPPGFIAPPMNNGGNFLLI